MQEKTPAMRMNETLAERKMQKKTLAESIGVPLTTLCSWLDRGKDFPAKYTVPIADTLGINPLWLLTGREYELPKAPERYMELEDDELFLLRAYRALDMEGKVVVTNKAIEEQRRIKSELGNEAGEGAAVAG